MSPFEERTVIGIDLGGTKIAAAVVAEDGTLMERELVATEAELGLDHVLGRLAAVVETLRTRTSRTVRAVGIGAPAPVSPSLGLVWEAPNLPGWERVPLRDILQASTGLPVALENDARAAGLAEARVGAGRGAQHMVFVTVGTGIGGAVVVDGRLVRGAAETAGEIGHMVMNPAGPRCGCGNLGCLEQYAAGPAIERRAVELLRTGTPSLLGELAPEQLTGERIAEAALQGDALGQQVYREAGHWLGAGIASLVNALNPELVVIGGGVAQTGDLIFDPVREGVRQHSLRRAHEVLTILPAQLGTDAGILGAAMAALDASA